MGSPPDRRHPRATVRALHQDSPFRGGWHLCHAHGHARPVHRPGRTGPAAGVGLSAEKTQPVAAQQSRGCGLQPGAAHRRHQQAGRHGPGPGPGNLQGQSEGQERRKLCVHLPGAGHSTQPDRYRFAPFCCPELFTGTPESDRQGLQLHHQYRGVGHVRPCPARVHDQPERPAG